jgi:hypothetical protein
MSDTPKTTSHDKPAEAAIQPAKPSDGAPAKPTEHGGPKGPEPTRYGDWEKNGRCIDF